MDKGILYLIPVPINRDQKMSDTLLPIYLEVVTDLEYFVVENPKTARAFLKDMDSKSINPKRLEVLYADDRGEFAYKDTLNDLNQKYNGLHIDLISDRNTFMEKIKEKSNEMKNSAIYYISGTPGMNAIITEKLLEVGVDKENIKTDNFIGY